MNTPRDDLQDFLNGDDPLNDLYATRNKIEPPAELDAAILGAAREHAKRPVRPRWFVPLSVAATVVLGTGLAIKQLSSPMRTVSESAVQEAMADDGMARTTDTAPDASGAAPTPRPSMDAIPSLAPEADFAPEPARVDVGEALRRTRQSTPLPAPELVPPAPAAPKRAAADADADADADVYAKASGDDTENIEAAAAAVANRLRSRAPSSQMTRSFQKDQTAARFSTSVPLANPEAYSNRKLDEVVSALRADRVDDAAAAYERTRDTVEGFNGQSGDSERSDNVRIDLMAQTLDRVRALHAAGEVLTAQQLLDLLVDVFPDASLPADLPLKPSATR